MNRNIPGTAKEIVDSIILSHDYTVKRIAEKLGVSSKTIYRIRNGFCPQPETHLNLISLFLHLHHRDNDLLASVVEE